MKINANHYYDIYTLNCTLVISTVGQAVVFLHTLYIECPCIDSRRPHIYIYQTRHCAPALLLRPAPPPGSHFFCAPRPLRPRAPANPDSRYLSVETFGAPRACPETHLPDSHGLPATHPATHLLGSQGHGTQSRRRNCRNVWWSTTGWN
jgi:hypothetical protein